MIIYQFNQLLLYSLQMGFICHFVAMKYLKVIAINLPGQDDDKEKNIFYREISGLSANCMS